MSGLYYYLLFVGVAIALFPMILKTIRKNKK